MATIDLVALEPLPLTPRRLKPQVRATFIAHHADGNVDTFTVLVPAHPDPDVVRGLAWEQLGCRLAQYARLTHLHTQPLDPAQAA